MISGMDFVVQTERRRDGGDVGTRSGENIGRKVVCFWQVGVPVLGNTSPVYADACVAGAEEGGRVIPLAPSRAKQLRTETA